MANMEGETDEPYRAEREHDHEVGSDAEGEPDEQPGEPEESASDDREEKQ